TQDYPPGRMEVLVVDGMSEDGTREIVRRLMDGHPQVPARILVNPKRIVPAGLNIAIGQARGDIIVRVDGHAIVSPRYVSESVAALARTGADAVGGPMTPVGHGWIGETIALAHGLRFGLGGGLFHRATEEIEADTVYMGIFRRDVFERVGLFDEDLARNQDIELNGRIRRGGGRIVLSPRIRSTYFCRDSLRGIWKQNFANGLWLVRTVRRNKEALSVRHFVPLAFLMALLLGSMAAVTLPLGWVVLAAVAGSYVLASAAASIAAAGGHGWRFTAALPLVFAILHVSYGVGSLVGICRMVAQNVRRRLPSRTHR
ncbi:MAG: glycosyltransferase family 2 protein, partial [Thermoplasmata archaeon]